MPVVPDPSLSRRRDDSDDERYLTRREADVLIANDEDRNAGHLREHAHEKEALEKALDVAQRDQHTHNDWHDREHSTHEAKHKTEGHAVDLALQAVARERTIHSEAHEREHLAHQREHELNNLALLKAERTNDIRFDGVNAFRESLRDASTRLASSERVETLASDVDRRFNEMLTLLNDRFQAAEKLTQERYEANRSSIIAIEKADVKGEGRSLGQGSIVAYIVTAVGLVGGLLGIVIILANFATRTT